MIGPREVLIDASGFMCAIQFKLDLFWELSKLGFNKHITTTGVIQELRKLSRSNPGPIRARAMLALDLAGNCELLEFPPGDSGLIQAALSRRSYVFTQDSKLRSKLKSLGIGVICLRAFKRLEIC